MPSRRRPKAPPVPERQLSDAERFAQAVRDSEEAPRRAKQQAADRKAEKLRLETEAAERAATLAAAQVAHVKAVERLKDARRNGRGVPEAEAVWRKAKADLLEAETGERPTWAPRPPTPVESADIAGEPGTEDTAES